MTTPVDNRDPQDDHVRVYYVQMTEEQYDGFRSVSEKHQDFIDATFVYRVDDSAPVRDTEERPRQDSDPSQDSDDDSGSDHPKSAVATAPTTTAAVSASEHV